jgi:hypothetical protein
MKICVVGWHYNKQFYEVLKEISTKYEVFVVAHRDNDILHAFDHHIRENTGLEFGAYDWYLKNKWDKQSSVFFIHDDTEALPVAFDYVANLDLCNVDQAYINFDEGGHGRAIFISAALLTYLLNTTCNGCQYCRESRDRYNPATTLSAITPHNGFLYDPNNTGHTTGTPPPTVRHFNFAIHWFHKTMCNLRTVDRLDGKRDKWSVVNRLVVPEFDLYKRGNKWDNLGAIRFNNKDAELKLTTKRVKVPEVVKECEVCGNNVDFDISPDIIYDRLNPTEEEAELIVYTALIGPYDNLQPVYGQSEKIRFVCFTDNNIKNPNGWEIVKIDRQLADPVRENRRLKVNSHLLFPNKETLYLDANLKPTRDLLAFVRSKYRSHGDIDLLLTKHPKRNCVYEEINRCKQAKLDDLNILDAKIIEYQRAGYPYNAGLYECNFIYRKPAEKVLKFNEMWWKEICSGSRRDQISCPIAVMNSGVRVALISAKERDDVIERTNHLGKREFKG